MTQARCGAVLARWGWVLLAILAAGCGSEDPAARIDRLRRAGNLEALAKEAAAPDITTARLAVRALGSLGPKAVPHLERILGDGRDEVREMATLALGQAGAWSEGARLASVLRGDESPMVRAAAATALGHLCAVDEVEAILEALEDADPAVRQRAFQAVAEITGISFVLPAGGPQRHETVERIRALWPKMKADVRAYHVARGAGQSPQTRKSQARTAPRLAWSVRSHRSGVTVT